VKQTLSTGAFLSFLGIKIKFMKHNIRGFFLLLNYLKKKFSKLLKVDSSFFIYVLGLKKNLLNFILKLNDVFVHFNVTGFFFKPSVSTSLNKKIKRFIKRRIKKKLIKIENQGV
jgi:hypothetical protein